MASEMLPPFEEPPQLLKPSEPPPIPAFVEVFEQMQALHLKLWDAHQAMVVHVVPMPSTLQPRLPSPGKAHASSEVSMDHVDSEPASREEEPLSARMSRKLVQKAKKVSHTIDDRIERSDSVDSLRLRPEWDVTDERLRELKRVQRRLSAGSISTTVRKVRQYLLKSEEVHPHPCYVVNPHSWMRTCWDVLVVLAILLEIWASPLHLYNLSEASRRIFNVLQWVLTSFWTLDIPASFCTATYINGILHFRLQDIRREYLRTWFFFDVLMLLPDFLVLFLKIYDGPAGVLRVARMHRVLRLGRFVQVLRTERFTKQRWKPPCPARIWKTLERFQSSRRDTLSFIRRDDLRTFIQPVLCMAFSLFAAVHVLGSLWFAAGDAQGGWVWEEQLQLQEVSRQYTRSVEWAIAKLPPSSLKLTVDLKTPAERWLGIAGTCLALLCGSVFVSFVTNSMADFAKSRVRTREILWSVQKYCGTHGISAVYAMQIRRYVEREHRRNETARHMQLLKSLPDGMVRELFHEAHSSILHRHAFFKEIGEHDNSMEVNLCSAAVSEAHVLAGDIIFDLSSKPKGMYFLAQGVAIYFHSYAPPVASPREDKNKTIAQSTSGILPSLFPKKVRSRADANMFQTIVETGEYVAEPALWIKTWRHQGQLQSTLDARAVLVSTEQLFKVLQDYANTMADAIVYARCFVKEINRSSLAEELTDLPLIHVGPRNRRSQVVPESRNADMLGTDDFFLP